MVKGCKVRNRKLRIILLGIAILIAAMVIGGAAYVNDYYHADVWAIEAMQSDGGVAVDCLDDNTLAFVPEHVRAGLIFYPGGKVEYTAYAPLMQTFAEDGILCLLVQMPFNLAMLDVNAADGLVDLYPEVETWYIGGHSLGGAMAASYVSNHTDLFQGLILLAAYSTADIADSDLSVVSVYGTSDQVLNMESYEKYKGNLPDSALEVVIGGGCHSYFGSYGRQKGDGEATISREDQMQKTVEAFLQTLE